MELCPQCGWPHDAPRIESESTVIQCGCGWSGHPQQMVAVAGEIATKHVRLIDKMTVFHLELAKSFSPALAQLLIRHEFVDPKKPSVQEFAHLLKDSTNAACRVIFEKLFTEKKDATAEPGREVHRTA